MKHFQDTLLAFLSGALLSALLAGFAMHMRSAEKIELYKARLQETLEEIHRLEHEIDPKHEVFTHGNDEKMRSADAEAMTDRGSEDKEVGVGDKVEIEENAHHEHDHHMMHEQAIDLTGSGWNPSVTVDVHPDPMAGWNVHIQTTDFAFSPESASAEHVQGEGHAHLYVDGEKIARVYGSWFHIGSLEPGTHTVRVTLNSNTHQSLLIDGSDVGDEVEVTVE